MKKRKIIRFSLLVTIAALGLIIAIAQGNRHTPAIVNQSKIIQAVTDEDTTDIGVETNDNPWDEMDKLVKAYYNRDGITYTGNIKLLDDNQDVERIVEDKPFECTFINGSYDYTFGSVEVIDKKNYVVAVDHENRSIAIVPHARNKNKGNFFQIDAFKKMMVERRASAKVTQLGNEKVLTIDNIADPSIQGYHIYYSPETYRVHKMLIGMVRTNALEPAQQDNSTGMSFWGSASAYPELSAYSYFLEINYTGAKTLSISENEFNPENKFITIRKNNIALTGAYNSYRLMSEMPDRNKK